MAKKFFGNERNIIGRTLKVDNQENFVISGVVRDLPENSTLQLEWLAPFKIYLDKNNWLLQWGNNGIQTYVEAHPATNIQDLNKKLYGYIQSKDTGAVAKPFLISMNDWRLRSEYKDGKLVGGRIEYVRMFSIIAWIILLIACINFMNLATARSEKRAKEVGVRKVLGANKGILARQFIGEAVFMSFLSVLFSIGIMYLRVTSIQYTGRKTSQPGIGQSRAFGRLVNHRPGLRSDCRKLSIHLPLFFQPGFCI